MYVRVELRNKEVDYARMLKYRGQQTVMVMVLEDTVMDYID